MGKYRLRAKDLRQKDPQELRSMLMEVREELVALRQKAISGSIDSPAKIRELRKNIARMLTILAEKQREAARVQGAASKTSVSAAGNATKQG